MFNARKFFTKFEEFWSLSSVSHSAGPGFLIYKRKDELDAVELGLEFLGDSYQDVLNWMVDALANLNVSRSKSIHIA